MTRKRILTTLLAGLVGLSLFAQTYTYNLRRRAIPSANYSGIAAIGDGRYAVVSDKEPEAGFYVWHIQLDSLSGKLLSVRNEGWRGSSWRGGRDAEGIAFCPQWQTLFVSGEQDQRIVEHRLDGSLTGRELNIPAPFGKEQIRPNRGFEALGYDAGQGIFWTCTESALPADKPCQLRLLAFGSDLQLVREVPYSLDTPLSLSPGQDEKDAGDGKATAPAPIHGLVAIAPLPDGSLLTLEREAKIARHYNNSRCWCKVFRFHPREGRKELLASWRTRFTAFNTRFANYEGMCLGPVLADGRQTVLLLSDSQSAYGRGPWHLKDYLRILVLP